MMPRPFGPKAVADLHIAHARVCRYESIDSVLVALGMAGIDLGAHPADPGRLRYRPTTLPPDLLEWLHAHRAAILGLLSSIDGKGGYAPAGGDAAIVYGERLGMADGLGMPTHPGSPAWLVALGEGTSCGIATCVVHFGHGQTDKLDSGGGESERANVLRDRQGRRRGT